jgi:hypothetical protein
MNILIIVVQFMLALSILSLGIRHATQPENVYTLSDKNARRFGILEIVASTVALLFLIISLFVK